MHKFNLWLYELFYTRNKTTEFLNIIFMCISYYAFLTLLAYSNQRICAILPENHPDSRTKEIFSGRPENFPIVRRPSRRLGVLCRRSSESHTSFYKINCGHKNSFCQWNRKNEQEPVKQIVLTNDIVCQNRLKTFNNSHFSSTELRSHNPHSNRFKNIDLQPKYFM